MIRQCINLAKSIRAAVANRGRTLTGIRSSQDSESSLIRNQLFVCGVIASILLIPDGVKAEENADNKARLTINDINQVDDDFGYMGEYQGTVFTPTGGNCPIGLQVVAMGDGKFGGMQYACGLPGTGWNRVDRAKIEGEAKDGKVEAMGHDLRFEIANGNVSAFDMSGNEVGRLHKVHRQSPTLGMAAPPNALTLFDGHDTNAFKNGKMTDEGLLEEGTELLSRFRDFTLHVEYRLPYMPHARGQGRSNSGIYLQSSYEVQVLDSFGLEGVENECGALYRYKRPDQNMCLPPLQWQTYDITFRSPRFDALGNKVQNARLTVLHNGVAVHNNFEVERKTGAGKQESPTLHPTKFQDHSNPVRYRNIWLIDLQQPTHTRMVACDTVAFPTETYSAPATPWAEAPSENVQHADVDEPTPAQPEPTLAEPEPTPAEPEPTPAEVPARETGSKILEPESEVAPGS